MRTVRLFCDTIESNSSVLMSGPQLHHLAKVLRLTRGDLVELFDGRGAVATAVVEDLGKRKAVLKVESVEQIPARQSGRIIIASSIAKGHRFETLIARCTELGADVIVPVIFERTVKYNSGPNSQNRLKTIAIESAKQCCRNFLPVIEEPVDLKSAIEKIGSGFPKSKMLFGSLSKPVKSIINFDSDGADVVVFVGPEGGLTDFEQQLLTDAGAVGASLTSTVLRIETAAIASAAILAAKRDMKE